MNPGERRDQVLLYLADLLEPDERAELLAWAEREPETFERMLAEARELERDLTASLEPVAPAPEIRDRLARRSLPTRTSSIESGSPESSGSSIG